MPRDGCLFNLAFTEVELLCTLHLSQHHLKCYKLLKYLVNGEPFPRERHTNKIIKPFLDSKTVFHSYDLKKYIWSHQYKQKCTQESDLSFCINYILRSLERDSGKHCFLQRKQGLSISILSLRTLQKGIERIENTSEEKYKFETFCHIVESYGLRKYSARTCEQILFALYLVMNLIPYLVVFFFLYIKR